MSIIAFLFFAAGAMAGSFASALSWRMHEHKDWVKARSQCPKCGHTLAPQDLVPIFSWLGMRGRCRYCRQPISALYPLVELAGGVVFASSYLFWPGGLSAAANRFDLGIWLFTAVILLSLALYDLRWRLLPNKLIYPAVALAGLGRLAHIIIFATHPASELAQWGAALLIASGLFWLLYQFSSGKLIGFGDVRLGVVTGSILATPSRALFMIFAASVLGSAAALPDLLKHRKGLGSQIAYGPFLIIATYISLLWGNAIISWYRGLLG